MKRKASYSVQKERKEDPFSIEAVPMVEAYSKSPLHGMGVTGRVEDADCEDAAEGSPARLTWKRRELFHTTQRDRLRSSQGMKALRGGAAIDEAVNPLNQVGN